MEVGQTAAELPTEPENFIERPLAPRPQVLGQRSAAQVLEHHVLDGAMCVHVIVVKRHDVGMTADTAKNSSLPLGAFRILQNPLRLDEGDRHQPVHLLISRPVRPLPATLTQPPLNLITAREDLAGLEFCTHRHSYLPQLVHSPSTQSGSAPTARWSDAIRSSTGKVRPQT